jgi:hypothetical protein
MLVQARSRRSPAPAISTKRGRDTRSRKTDTPVPAGSTSIVVTPPRVMTPGGDLLVARLVEHADLGASLRDRHARLQPPDRRHTPHAGCSRSGQGYRQPHIRLRFGHDPGKRARRDANHRTGDAIDVDARTDDGWV